MTGLPVIANGGLHDPDLADDVIGRRTADRLPPTVTRSGRHDAELQHPLQTVRKLEGRES
ncbi:hypothetical protein [Stieleria maiorica]|nr:hypothetical protein [Stieleria maiorica]